MDNLEAKMGSILSNPEMMQKIMAMAQSLNQSGAAPSQEDAPTPRAETNTAASRDGANAPAPALDLATVQKLSGFAKQTGLDSNQQALLKALRPYLSRERIAKLEKAMRSAKLARIASSFLGSSGLQSLLGR